MNRRVAAARAAVAPPGVGAVGAQYRGPEQGSWVQRWYDGFGGHTAAPGLTAWLGAGNLVVRREAFVAVGGFDESLESCEDVDLCFRLRGAGWAVVNEPGMRSTHHGDPTTLRRLYRSELWRGRDNMRVSLRERPLSSWRPPMTWRERSRSWPAPPIIARERPRVRVRARTARTLSSSL